MNTEEKHPPVRVWILEDNETFRRSLQRLCSSTQGFTCGGAFANAESMFEKLRTEPALSRPEVLLLDIGLPGQSGLEAIPQVLQLASSCRLVILTVFEDEEKIATAISAGACGYLLKTSRPEEIVGAIREAYDGGSPMSPHVARSVVNLLARLTKRTPSIALSPRERELLSLLVEGLTAKEITDRLGVSIHTTDTHTRHLFAKLGVRNRAAAVAKALRENLI